MTAQTEIFSMKSPGKFFAATALVLSLGLAAPVMAQDAGPDQGPPPPHRLSPEVMQRLMDGRVAFIETALRLSPEQQKLWEPVAQILRERPARPDRPDRRGSEPPVLSDMLMQRSQMMEARAEQQEKLAAALKPLEASLSDEQKQALAVAFFAGMDRDGPHRDGPRHGHMPPPPPPASPDDDSNRG